jgi:hypothetical protein
MGSRKINDLWVSTFLFSVICDRVRRDPPSALAGGGAGRDSPPQAGGGGVRGGCPGATWRGLSWAHQGRVPGRLLPPPGRRRRGARLRRETRLQLQAMRQLLHALFT